MAVKLRLKRMGRSHLAYFRLHAVDSRSPVDGRVIEELGHYEPGHKDSAKQFIANLDRCKYWMDHGAQPSGTVSSLLKKSGVEHRMLKLPTPGKPKVDPAAAAAAAKKDEAKAAPEAPAAADKAKAAPETPAAEKAEAKVEAKA